MQLPNNRIMIVDDNVEFSSIIQKLLLKYGFECEIFHTSQEALENFKNNYSIFILDINLGESDADGLELLQTVKSYKPMSSVIMITGYQSYEKLVHCISAGASDFFIKSNLDREYIVNTIDREVAKQRNWLSVMSNINKKTEDEFFEFEEKAPLDSAKVAFIDDDPEFINLLNKVTNKLKISADMFSNPDILFDKEESYNLIFIDLWLGGKNGIEYIKKIKGKFPFADIVVVSGDISADTMAICSEYGATDYVFKESFNITALSSIIENTSAKFTRWKRNRPTLESNFNL